MTPKHNLSDGGRTSQRAELSEAIAELLPLCAGCGERFTPKRPQQKFCRPSCRHLDGPVQLPLFP